MRRHATRLCATLVVLLAALASGGWAVDAAARKAAGVDLATTAVGSLGRADRSGTVHLPLRADVLGATWRGSADAVELRARGADGRWSRWVELHAGDHGPDPRSAEARAASRRLGTQRTASSPMWVGDAEQVQLRTHDGQPAADVRIVAINASGTATRAERAASSARRGAAWVLGEASSTAQAIPYAPGIRSRTSWGASKPRSEPALALETGVVGAVVHHTASTNRYSCSQVPALLRGIQRYHMNTNGWNDIGYNFLVDACGGVWEGRAGGVTRPVIGAHSSGFNTSTTGIALLGTHSTLRPTLRASDALRRLLAWRLDVAHVKPTGKMALTARTGDKFPLGSRVVVRAVSGHRDLFPTSCPGALGYAGLGSVSRLAWITGGAKVANVTRGFVLRNPADPLDPSLARVVVRAVASHSDMALGIRVERISTGELLHSASLTGPVISTTWLVPAAASIPSWDVRVRVAGDRAGQRARPASLHLQPVPPDPGFVVTAAPQPTVAPGGDPADDLVRLSYTLAQEYRLGAWLHDAATGTQAAVLQEPDYVGTPGEPTALELAIPEHVADGNYELRVGLPADPAAGRSIRRFALIVDRP